MLKSIKFFAIILIIFAIFISFYSVYASSIDMNLVDNQLSNPDTNYNDVDENITTDDDFDSQMPTDSDEIAPPSGVSATAEDGLGFNSILNIFLITIGIILILLSIAIIIRLK